MHTKVLAAPFDRDKAERVRDKFIEIQVLIDALDRIAGRHRIALSRSDYGKDGRGSGLGSGLGVTGWPVSCFDRFALT